ncbi:MAG: hypothetical protein KTR16_14995 [Acidiferrobacterales bacterium]|nr:hypothetical protein [Acidiferrobacterales bacterium]
MSQIEELRQIIVGADSEKLNELKERIENVESRTRDVLEVLPPAILAGVQQDDRLIKAFQKPVSESLKRSVRAEPEEYAQILYPVMGPSIRRAISQSISSLMVTINQSIESATSAQGLKLRLQSMRTGIPYAELALRQSLKFKVEHLYLIDRESGMMISEARGDGTSSLDSDAVSGMLSAIQSFVQDSFSQNDDDRLSDFKVGQHNVWIAHGRSAMLACVIFGEAPESLKTELYDKLDFIRTEYAQELNRFDGDTSIFFGIEDKLKPLIQLELQDDQDSFGGSGKPSIGKILLILGIVAGLLYLGYNWFNANSKLNTVEQYLKEVPGLVVTNTFWEDDVMVVEGLQDFDANIPFSVLRTKNIERDLLEFRTVPFLSLDPEIELRRLDNELSIPDALKLEILEDRLIIAGHADVTWLLDNDISLRHLASSHRLNASELYASFSSLRDYHEAKEIDLADMGEEILTMSMTPWFDLPASAFRN